MAIFRNIHLSFWTDTKVVDDFTPEDRYFYLYLMTNPHTNLIGCYEVSIRQIASETGYSKDVVERLLERMEKIHDVIRYNKDKKELLILNWWKYNWTKSPKLQPAIDKGIESVKTPEFADYLEKISQGIDTVSIGYLYGRHTTDTDTDIDTNTNSVIENDLDTIKEIIDYLNTKTLKKYTSTRDNTKKHIRARLREGYTVDDFKKVIDNKCNEWLNDPKMNTYLRPDTLFGSHFEDYLNQGEVKNTRYSFLDD